MGLRRKITEDFLVCVSFCGNAMSFQESHILHSPRLHGPASWGLGTMQKLNCKLQNEGEHGTREKRANRFALVFCRTGGYKLWMSWNRSELRGVLGMGVWAVLLVVTAVQGRAQNNRLDVAAESVEPFQIFDNVYYIGTSWVSCYAVDTGDGLVLIDALYGGFPQQALKHLKQLGLGDEKIRYVLATHGHWDHAGGAAFFQQETGATVGMTRADWELAQASARQGQVALFTGGAPEQQLVIEDGDVLKVGNMLFHCFVTPGHTEGVLSLAFDVASAGQRHRAFVFGGVGLNFSGVARTRSYLNSVDRILKMAGGSPPIEVSLSNHPQMGRILERSEQLKRRRAGQPHPFVAADHFLRDLMQWKRNALKKLEDELAVVGGNRE